MSCAALCGDSTVFVAVVKVKGSSEDSPVSGNVLLLQESADSGVYMIGGINGLEPGPHGFHIHENGSTDGK